MSATTGIRPVTHTHNFQPDAAGHHYLEKFLTGSGMERTWIVVHERLMICRCAPGQMVISGQAPLKELCTCERPGRIIA